MSTYDVDAISDEYLVDFFERVQYLHAPGKVVWHRISNDVFDFGALLRGSLNSIEVGWDNAPDSRTDGAEDTGGSIYLHTFWPSGDFHEDFLQFRSLMHIWALHEVDEWMRVDGELYLDPHDPEQFEHSAQKHLLDAHDARWAPAYDEEFV